MQGLFRETLQQEADTHSPAILRGDRAIEATHPVLKRANEWVKIGRLAMIEPDDRPCSCLWMISPDVDPLVHGCAAGHVGNRTGHCAGMI
jgi:hypothetical protein